MNTKKMKTRQERFNRTKPTLRKCEAVIEIIIMSLLFYLVWVFCYREEMHPYFGFGKYILIGIYMVLTGGLLVVLDGHKFGQILKKELFSSQIIALVFTNAITYFQLCLMATHMLYVLPMIGLTVAELIVSWFLLYIFQKIYQTLNVPQNMLLLYGNESGLELKHKMDLRTEKYRITEVLNVVTEREKVREAVQHHDSVILSDVPAEARNDILKACYANNIRTYLVPKISDIIDRGAEELTMFDTPLLLINTQGLTPLQNVLKRIGDILLSLIALIISSPVWLVVACAIKAEDHGPVFYRQERITKNGKRFMILKFRSMIQDAEKGQYNLSMRCRGDDPRITKTGKIIRKCRLDELPQILNILKGDMSIVGPRPERVENTERYTEEIPEFIFRNKVKAGLTGYAQVYGKYNTTPYDKIRLDLMYIEKYSILLDIKLIFMTIQVIFKPEATEGFKTVIPEKNERKDQLFEVTAKAEKEHV